MAQKLIRAGAGDKVACGHDPDTGIGTSVHVDVAGWIITFPERERAHDDGPPGPPRLPARPVTDP